ncbi:pyridoxal-phosphate dependent enzyme [Rhodobacteraceae bacterium]|nr:pyridoxal-phosphate dependent enzyme [Paracoccaceae bacterium]
MKSLIKRSSQESSTMPGLALYCFSCQKSYDFEMRFTPCNTCSNPLQVKYGTTIKSSDFNALAADPTGFGLSRFKDLLPLPSDVDCVSLGEGNTPLIQLPKLSIETGLEKLWVKNESANPSWSFKDRLNSVNASLAKAYSFPGIIASSTGNHGASAAAYAAAAGLKSVVLFPDGTPDIYLKQVQAYGGTAVSMDWKERGGLLARFVNELGWYPSKSSLPAPISNPFGVEGYKTVAYELALNMRTTEMPEYIFIPIGSGDDYFGMTQGFSELFEIGIISRIPTLVACEATGSCPLHEAVVSGADSIEQISNPRTHAISISEGIVSNLALDGLRKVGGKTCTVSEAEIREAAILLAKSGIVAESSSCVSTACAVKFAKLNDLPADTTMVVMLTATGLRWPTQIVEIDRASTFKGRGDEFNRLLEASSRI